MTVTTARYGKWATHVGTMAEVAAALNAADISPGKAWIFYNGTNVTGVVYGG